MNLNTKELVVGIGTSAGGLEALKLFFHNIPSNTKLIFVVIQHLSSDHKSLMKELLAKGTDLPVLETTDNLQIKPGHIYLIPPKSNIILKNNKLKLIEKAGKNQLNLPIDIFFHSLAKSQKEKSVGIILTGTGSDGVEGIKSIKSEGGLIMVQNANEAKFNGMPISAINTGIVDFVLPVELIANELVRYSELQGKEYGLSSTTTDDQYVTAILNQIMYRTQLNFNHYKRPTIIRRIRRRMVVNKIEGLKEYLDFIGKHPEESEILYKEFLIPVTKFFRDAIVWETLRDTVIPDIVIKTAEHDTIKVWSVGCCSGEEVYSTAILFLEEFEHQEKSINLKIFATDIDKASLKKAGDGIYPENIKNELPEHLAKKYFVSKGAELKVTETLRKSIIYSYHNVISDLPYNKMDMVLCRNMLIYIRPSVQEKVLNTLHYATKKGGYLVLGSSESLGKIDNSFDEINPKSKVFKNKVNAKISYFSGFNVPIEDNSTELSEYAKSFSKKLNLSEIINNNLVEQLDITSVLIKDDFEILEVNGQFRKYLAFPDKGFSKYLNKIIPNNISFGISSAVRRVEKQRNPVNFNDEIEFANGTVSQVKVNVSSVVNPNDSGSNFYLILFKELKSKEVYEKSNPIELGDKTLERIQELEQELNTAKKHLQATIEVAETSNEELQATNEELLASNEELQSTNEELQSVNEELHTVNAEFQAKINEISQLNIDNENLMKSTNIGTIFLDANLNIRKFIGPISEQLNILERDLGREISDITTKLNSITEFRLLEDINKVNATGKSIENKVCTNNGDWYLQRTLPYSNSVSEQEGVVVSFININTLVEKEKILRQNEERFRALYEDAPIMHVNVCPKTAKILDCNKKLVERLGYSSKKQVVGRSIFDAYHPDCIPEVENAFMTFKQTGTVKDRELILQDRKGNKIPVILNVSSVKNEDGDVIYSSSSWVEVSKLKEVSSELQIRNQDLEQFTYLISHDLKAPLTNLKSLTDIVVSENYVKPEGEEIFELISESSQRLFDTIDTLNEVVTLTWNKKLPSSRIDIENEINSTLKTLNTQIKSSNSLIEIDCSKQKFLDFPKVHFGVIMQNLILNSIKYAQKDVNPHIQISSGKRHMKTYIEIKDNGIGMDLELVKDKLFSLFQRFNEAEIDGRGIGLHVTHNLIKKYGGDIEVESKPGQGSTFTLYFSK
jgi:two-component system CheB/CheR fusion protein